MARKKEEAGMVLEESDPSAWGHIKISRKAYETDPLWLEERVFSRWEAWEWMIQAAAWRDHQRTIGSTVVELKRGEFVASLRFLAEKWGWSVKKVRGLLRYLENRAQVRAHRETPVGTVLYLVNYDVYQGSVEADEHEKGHREETARAQQGHSKGTKEKQLKAGEAGEVKVGQSVSRSGERPIESIERRQTQPDNPIAAIVAAVNAGMLDNPMLGEGNFYPLDPDDEDHREIVSRWLAEGISPSSIAEEVYHGASRYRPRGARKQIERLSYFERPIRKRHALDTSRHVERPKKGAATVPRNTEAVSVRSETPGAIRQHTEPREAPPEALREILAGIAGRGWNLDKWLPKKPAA